MAIMGGPPRSEEGRRKRLPHNFPLS